MHTEAVLESLRRWKEQPDQAQSQTTVTARADGTQAVIEAGPFSWRADLPSALGGAHQAPSPTALLLGALAGCAVVFLRDTLAPLLNVPVTDVRATVRGRADFRGLLGLDGAAPDLTDLTLEIEVTSPRAEREVRSLVQAWLERCPVYLALLKPMAVDTRVAIRQG